MTLTNILKDTRRYIPSKMMSLLFAVPWHKKVLFNDGKMQMVPAVGFWVEILRRINNNLLYISVENTCQKINKKELSSDLKGEI